MAALICSKKLTSQMQVIRSKPTMVRIWLARFANTRTLLTAQWSLGRDKPGLNESSSWMPQLSYWISLTTSIIHGWNRPKKAHIDKWYCKNSLRHTKNQLRIVVSDCTTYHGISPRALDAVLDLETEKVVVRMNCCRQSLSLVVAP